MEGTQPQEGRLAHSILLRNPCPQLQISEAWVFSPISQWQSWLDSQGDWTNSVVEVSTRPPPQAD